MALVTGHHDPDSPDCTLDWDALLACLGLVFYMGVRHAAKIATKLSDSGLSPEHAGSGDRIRARSRAARPRRRTWASIGDIDGSRRDYRPGGVRRR